MKKVKLQNCEVTIYDELKSTQEFLINKIKAGNIQRSEIIYTKNQTNGIGRSNTKWVSFEGCLTFSFSIFGKIQDFELAILNYICMVLEDYNVESFIKWPNDIYLNKNKICGVIIDKINDYFVVGIGINLYNYYRGYESISSLKNIIIPEFEFIDKLFFHIVYKTIVVKNYYKIPDVIMFDSEFYKIRKINFYEILITDNKMNDKTLSSLKYSYDIQKNCIVKKL